MKKSLLTILLMLLIGIAAWYIQSDLRSSYPIDQLTDKNEPANLIEQPKEDIAAAPAQDSLKTQALKIISKPLLFKNNLSDKEKELFKKKNDELTGLIRQNYDYINAWHDLGSYRKLMGDYEGAIEAWNFIGLIRPKDYISYHNLGELYGFYLKDYEKAEQNFLKSINNNPANIDGYLQLVTVYEYGYAEKAAEAENVLLLGIKSNPTDPNIKIALGEYYQKQNKISEAIKYFEEALKLNPANKMLEEEIKKLKNS
jgi:tetratricopeptide (TPR) repeat protein